MNTPLLEILIPTMPSRKALLERLLAALTAQMPADPDLVRLTVLTDDQPTLETIGAKRQRGVLSAVGEYVAFIDDDDMPAADYIPRVLAALESRPSCVGLSVRFWCDSEQREDFEHSVRHRENRNWQGTCRTPHHLCPIRREIAQLGHWPHLNWGEDYAFAMSILPHLTTEVLITGEPMYHYHWRSAKKPGE